MDRPRKIIHRALADKQTALNEYDAKRFLKHFGIPVTREALTSDVESASAKAEKTGFPVVVKAPGSKLTHKTEASRLSNSCRS